MKKTKVIFEVTYEMALTKKIGDFMANLDLGISGVSLPVTEVWSWTTTTKVTSEYISKMRRAIKLALKQNGDTLLSAKYLTENLK